MPLYQFTCECCGEVMEQIMSREDSKVVELECPECGEFTPKDEIQAGSGFQLKGSGWFKDGY